MDTLGIALDTLFYDAADFFAFIASSDDKPKPAKPRHSKRKRADLRLFSLALPVSCEGQRPICSQLDEGNRIEVKSFPDSPRRIRQRPAKLSLELEGVTPDFDRGNLSKASRRLADGALFEPLMP